jgi:hypothetical protein
MSRHTRRFWSGQYGAASVRELQTLLGLLLIAALFSALWRSRRRPAIFLPLLIAVVCYLADQRIDHTQRTVAEHWLYLPSAFLLSRATAALEFFWMDDARKISNPGWQLLA